jgi:hypothetical protein
VDNVKKNLGETEWGGVDWIDLAQDRDRWRALVNAVMNLRVLRMLGYHRVAAQVMISGEVLNFTELLSLILLQSSTVKCVYKAEGLMK